MVLALAWLVTPAAAVEFQVEGNFNYEYEYNTALGNNGFFGPHDVDLAVVAPQFNHWIGFQFFNNQTHIHKVISSLDASQASQYTNIDIRMKINPALQLISRYYIGSWGPLDVATNRVIDPAGGVTVASEYISDTAPGVQRSFSPGYWNTFYMLAQLPWGQLAIGKRPSRFGVGMLWSGDDNTSSDSVALGTKYGPFRIGASFYPSRRGPEPYFVLDDKSNIRTVDNTYSIHYMAGPLATSFQFTHRMSHRGPESVVHTTVTNATRNLLRDRNDIYWGAYVKYQNGRFFFNAEYDQYRRDDFRRVTPTAALSTPAPDHRMHEQWMVETGAYAGPSKLSLLYARITGLDRRAALTVANNAPISGNLTNTPVFLPYNYLMIYSYGLGLVNTAAGGFQGGFVSQTGKGQAAAAVIYAARLDHAVASNLNIWGSFMYAIRPEKYAWGSLLPLWPTSPEVVADANRLGEVVFVPNGMGGTTTGANRSPSIPDNSLGWEVDLGFDWKLLENFHVKTLFAYWQPGKWFNFACVSKSNPGWTVGGAGNQWGIAPNRTIDPVFATNVAVIAEF